MKIGPLFAGTLLCLLAAHPTLAQTSTTSVTQSPDGSTTTTTETVKKDHGGTTPGALSGAVAGALVAGPIGAVVGGVAGATVGHSIAPPTEVKTYVTTQTVDPAVYSGDLAVGDVVSADIDWREVPDYPKYRWARLNGRRVVVEKETRKVVAIY